MKYLSQIVVLTIFSILLHLTHSYESIYWIMAFIISTMYLHPWLAVISESYRKRCESSVDFIQMITVACFATFNILVVLQGSPLRNFYGVGIGLSFIATSYPITRRA